MRRNQTCGEPSCTEVLGIASARLRVHIAGSMRRSLAARRSSRAATNRQMITATMEASGPKAPPVRIAGPLSVPTVKAFLGVNPETASPYRDPSEKFHPACNPIGNHKRPISTYAAASSTPASRVIATELVTVAPGLKPCAAPKKADDSAIAIQVPPII